MEMVLIKDGSQEWERMWDMVANHPINEGIEHPSIALNNGEGWQYMGSYRQDNRIIHEFKHRKHQRFGRIENIKFMASDKITDDDIENSRKVKG
jgi:hypothetical protein